MNLEDELRAVLSQNLALRLLLQERYTWLVPALAGAYYLVGILVAAQSQSLTVFLQSRFVYVLLIAAVACVAAARWYPRALIDMIAAIPNALQVAPGTVVQVVQDWMRLIRLPIPVAFGTLLATFGIWLGLSRPQVVGWPAHLPPWLLSYGAILLALCAVMLGGGVTVYLATIVLCRRLFQYEMRLSHYRRLAPLSTFAAGLTILAFVAVALLLLLVFDRIRPASVGVMVLGLLGGGLMFFSVQFAYQEAVVRARQHYLDQLAPVYERHYLAALQASADPEALRTVKVSLETLETIEKSLRSIPLYLIELSDAIRILWSSLAPILSVLIGPVLSRMGFS